MGVGLVRHADRSPQGQEAVGLKELLRNAIAPCRFFDRPRPALRPRQGEP
jgi:hypothetical protein